MTKQPHCIVLGNEKGGTGKSTVSMHVIVHLLRLGFSVASIDVDARQGTLSRYIAHRQESAKARGFPLPMPHHQAIMKSTHETRAQAEEDEQNRFDTAMAAVMDHDFLVIDTPGNDTYLSRLAHSHAHTVITPLNDSFIDLDMLAHVSQNQEIIKPSTYAEMVWEQKKRRLMRGDKTSFDWIVVRNRLSHVSARNKEEMQSILEKLAQRIGFRYGAGFGERVIFRSLFLSGLTLLDMKDMDMDLSLSHVAARQELRDLLKLIDLPMLDQRLDQAI